MKRWLNNSKLCQNLILVNGGTFSMNGTKANSVNTCSIDYFLMIVLIIYSNHSRNLNNKLIDCFSRIHEYLMTNNWDSARIEWLNFCPLLNIIYPPTKDSQTYTYNWFLSENESFAARYCKEFQMIKWKFKCSKETCINNNRQMSSFCFVLR